jgi:hypothetical protein
MLNPGDIFEYPHKDDSLQVKVNLKLREIAFVINFKARLMLSLCVSFTLI